MVSLMCTPFHALFWFSHIFDCYHTGLSFTVLSILPLQRARHFCTLLVDEKFSFRLKKFNSFESEYLVTQKMCHSTVSCTQINNSNYIITCLHNFT